MPDKIKILIIPSWYPTPYSQLDGCFFKEQAVYLSKADLDIGIIFPDLRPIWTLFKRKVLSNRFQTSLYAENDIKHVVYHGWKSKMLMGVRSHYLWTKHCIKLFHKYCDFYGKPQLLHAHCAIPAGFAAMKISQITGIPYIITEHWSYYAEKKIMDYELPLISQAFNNADRIITVSRFMANSVKEYTSTAIQVIPNAVDTDYFQCTAPRTKKHIFKFLTISVALEPNKNIELIINSFARAFSQNSSVYLDIIGDGPLRKHLSKLVSRLNLIDRVKFLGQIPRNIIKDTLCSANALLLASNYETFGISLIEALSTGIPVISTKSGGPEEIIKNTNGYLVEKNNVEQLSDAIRRIYDERDLWQQRHNELRDYAKKNFDTHLVAQQIKNFYSELLGYY